MMKKGFLGLILALCLTLLLLPASAEEAYVPGEITRALLKSAFDSGKIVGGDFTIALDMDTAMLTEGDEEAQAQLDAILGVIQDAEISVGVGKLEDGLRLELGASLTPEGTSGVSISGAADVTLDGISVESDVIAGKKVTATWETLLALAGVDGQTSAMILSLREVDWATAASEAAAQLQTTMVQAAQLAAPYFQTLASFAASLPMQTETDVAADATHPAAATKITVTFTKDDVRAVCLALADQLEQDENLVPLIDAMLAEVASDTSAPTDTAALCDAIREELEALTGSEPYTFVIGMDENDVPLFAEVTGLLGGGVYAACYPDGNAQNFSFMLIDIADNGAVDMAISLSGTFAADADDLKLAQNVDFTMKMQGIENDVPVASLDYAVTGRPLTTGDDQPGYQVEGAMDMTVSEDDESTMRETLFMNIEQAKTATGGEYSKVHTLLDIYADDTQASIVATGSMSIEPSDDGFTGLYTISEQMPLLGLRDLTLSAVLGARAYDADASAALTPLALESATSDDVNALGAQAVATLQQKMIQLLAALPQEVQQMILNAQ